MGDVFGSLLPTAVGIAISPVPIIAIILMLRTPKAKTNGPAFALGWIVALVIVTTVAVVLSSGADDTDSGASTTVGWLQIAIGMLFALMAARQWRSRPRPGEPAVTPSWMSAIDAFAAGKSLGLGAALAGVNPKNLALSLAAGATISQAGLSTSDDVIAVGFFVLVASLTVAGPVAVYLIAPRKSDALLADVEEFMVEHNAVIMMVVLLLLGAKLLGDGIQTLSI